VRASEAKGALVSLLNVLVAADLGPKIDPVLRARDPTFHACRHKVHPRNLSHSAEPAARVRGADLCLSPHVPVSALTRFILTSHT
jgi:hypothetical protein